MNPEFYEDEVYEGFYVPAMLKKAWGAQLDVLAETDRICRRHNIPYFADWGTLLATIRHNGYIPWDDDLDISMRRSDYERFLRYAETELPEGFKVMNFKNHPGHLFFVARIVGKPRICFEEDHLKRFHGFPYICGIDLFVLDNVCKDRKREALKAKAAEFVITVADGIADGKISGDEAKNCIEQVEGLTGIKAGETGDPEALRVRLYSIAEMLFASIPDEESDALVQMMPFGMYGNTRYIPKEFYRDTVRLPYMDTTISVPVCYDAVMRLKFGDYMVVRKQWNGHDYPFFYGQHRELLSVLDFEYPAYKADRETVISSVRSPGEGSDSSDIVFMPFASKHWKYMEKLYEKYVSSGYDVHVVPIPYYRKDWDGSLAEEVFDPGSYPSGINVTDYRSVDLEKMHPAKIVIQFPFDEWNPSISIPPQMYSAVLKKYTDELIYIPFFTTGDFTKESGREYINMDTYVCMPGVINADTVILPSQVLKDTYIEKLTEFTGADDDAVSDALDKKIKADPAVVFKKEDEPIHNESDKKTIVYFTTLSILAERGMDAVKKIEKTIDMFVSCRDRIRVRWITQCMDSIGLLDRNTADSFLKLVDRFKAENIGDYCENVQKKDHKSIADEDDAYYGDPSALALSFVYENKPVMLENVDIT